MHAGSGGVVRAAAHVLRGATWAQESADVRACMHVGCMRTVVWPERPIV